MKKLLIPILLFCVALFSILTFGSREMVQHSSTMSNLSQVPELSWQKLAQKQIVFAHASVGYNIIDGVQAIQKEHTQINLNVIEENAPSSLRTAGIHHFHFDKILPSSVQEATIPIAKIDSFAHLIKTVIQQSADIAFFELCWADVKPETDLSAAFLHYKRVMGELMQAFPKTTFVPVTMPLVAVPSGTVAFKNWIKQLFGKAPFYLADNIKINQFNALLRTEYAGKAPLFDLAQVESTRPDGKQQMFSSNGKDYFSMAADYTKDMGHLDETGRRVVAEQLLILLAKVAK